MRFAAASPNASFTVLAEDHIRDNYGRVISKIPGLRIQFAGGIFDSEAAAAERRWSEEQRLQAERHLLSHPDFGVMRTMDGGGKGEVQYGNVDRYRLYLAPGQLIPAEHADFVCSFRALTPEGVIPCPRPVKEGLPVCRQHERTLEGMRKAAAAVS
jgi:hypothetical protein